MKARPFLGLVVALSISIAPVATPNAAAVLATPDVTASAIAASKTAAFPTTGIAIDNHGHRVDPSRVVEEIVAKIPPNRLIVKLREGVNICLSCETKRRSQLRSLMPNSRLDELLRYHGLRSGRLLLGRATDTARSTRLQSRFSQRRTRARGLASLPEFDRTWIFQIRQGPDPAAVARMIAADPAVEYCEPDRLVKTAFTPNDPFLASAGSWGQNFDDLWGVKRIGAPQAWDTTHGAGVVIAIADTGIDYNHPDISANVWTNPSEIDGNGIDDDGNGFIDDVRGWDFADDDADPLDDNGHGSHVAGTAAAAGNNGQGVVGVAFESQVMAVRVLGTSGAGTVSGVAAGILYAVDNGADVINASFGGFGFSQTESDALAAAHAAGVVFVAAAGNSNADIEDFFPAADTNAITVAAFAHDDTRAFFSNFGIGIDVAAPGGGDAAPPKDSPVFSILSLLSDALSVGQRSSFRGLILSPGGAEYLRLAGTSMAAPHVSGAAALVLAADPTLTVEQVRQKLRATADDIAPPGPDDDSGHGLVNVAAAVLAPPPLEAHISSPMSGDEFVGPEFVSVLGSANGPGFTSYELDYRPSDDPNGWVPIAGPITTAVSEGMLAPWDMGVLTDGDYVVRLRADRAGEEFVDRVALSVRNVDISSPEPFAALRPDGPIEIRGTAAGPGFLSYQVEYRRPAIDGGGGSFDVTAGIWHTDVITLAAPPGVPVRDGLLATLDASFLTEGDTFDIRLLVENGAGTIERSRREIVIDPTLRQGWPQQLLPVGDREYLTVADLDGDGIQEILAGSGREVVVFEPDGSVRPGWPQSVVAGDSAVITRGSPLVADVAGDSAVEVIATNNHEIFVWSADGTLLPGFPVTVDVFTTINTWITAGDIDGDGKDEVICTGGNAGMSAYKGDGTQVIGWAPRFRTGNRPPAVADVLGDGGAEVAWFHPRREFFRGINGLARGVVALVKPDGVLNSESKTHGSFFSRVGMADMDGDGELDMVTLKEKINNHGKVKAFAYNSAGRRLGIKKPRIKGRRKDGGGLFSYADINRDGRAEAWAYVRIRQPATFEDEFGYFAPFQERRTPVPVEPLEHRLFAHSIFTDRVGGIAIGDIDGDGVQELVGGIVAEGCGVVELECLGGRSLRRALPVQRPDGSLVAGFPKPIPNNGGERPGIHASSFIDDPRYATPAIADLDGDGLKEIIWVDTMTTRIFVWNVPGTPGPLLADWPMYHHDPKHSNTLPVNP